MLTRDGAGEVRLPIGTAGQVLQVNAGGTDPEWATLGTMSAQNANAVAITGGTISGLTTPLAVADGGTGLNALGTAGQAPVVNSTADALVYAPVDLLTPTGPNITDLDTAVTAGTWVVTGTAANKPSLASSNYSFVVVRVYSTTYIYQTFHDTSNNHHFTRYSKNTGTTWSDWIPLGWCPGFRATGSGNFNITTSGNTTAPFTVKEYDNFNAFDTTTHTYTFPLAGKWLCYGRIVYYPGTYSAAWNDNNLTGWYVWTASFQTTIKNTNGNQFTVSSVQVKAKGDTLFGTLYTEGTNGYIVMGSSYIGAIYLGEA